METQFKENRSVQQKTKPKRPSFYNVVMLNDDFTPMDFVVWALKHYFNKDQQEAERLMLLVHNSDRAVVATYTYDIAVTKCNAVVRVARQQGYPFNVIPEEAKE